MSITAITNKVREQGNGSKVDFVTTFPVQETSHLAVYKVVRATDVATLQTLITDYTVAISTVTRIATVTYVVAPTALQDSFIVRTVPLTQGADVPTNNIFREVQIENALDKQMMAIQQIDEKVERAVKLPLTSSITEVTLPEPEDGLAIVWDGTSGAMKNEDFTGPTGPTGATGPAGADGIFSAIASQAEAEAGSENTKGMTALRTAQAITALAPGFAAIDITGQSAADIAVGDSIVFSDADDSGALKKDTVQGVLDLVGATWVDYSSTSTIVGLESYSTKEIQYMIIGKTLFFNCAIVGGANGTTVSFTLPYGVKTGVVTMIPVSFAYDNNAYQSVPYYGSISTSGVLTATKYDGSAWTNANGAGRHLRMQGFYQLA